MAWEGVSTLVGLGPLASFQLKILSLLSAPAVLSVISDFGIPWMVFMPELQPSDHVAELHAVFGEGCFRDDARADVHAGSGNIRQRQVFFMRTYECRRPYQLERLTRFEYTGGSGIHQYSLPQFVLEEEFSSVKPKMMSDATSWAQHQRARINITKRVVVILRFQDNVFHIFWPPYIWFPFSREWTCTGFIASLAGKISH